MALRDGRSAGRMLGAGSLDGVQRRLTRLVPDQLERKTRHHTMSPMRIGKPVPILTSISPSVLPMGGGVVTITGDYFDPECGIGVSPQGVSPPTGTLVTSETTLTTTITSNTFLDK